MPYRVKKHIHFNLVLIMKGMPPPQPPFIHAVLQNISLLGGGGGLVLHVRAKITCLLCAMYVLFTLLCEIQIGCYAEV